MNIPARTGAGPASTNLFENSRFSCLGTIGVEKRDGVDYIARSPA